MNTPLWLRWQATASIGLALLAGGAAHAQVSCELDASTDVNVDFGSELPYTPRDATSPTGFNLSCTNSGQAARNVKVCVGLGPGTGGESGGGFRQMQANDNSGRISYDLYAHPSRATWSRVGYSTNQLEASGPVPANTTAQIIMPGRLYGRTAIRASLPRLYSSTFSGGDVAITWQDYDPGAPEPACAELTQTLAFPGSFTVSMEVPTACDFANTNTTLNFGSRSSLLNAINAPAAFTIACAIGVNYTASVSDGLHAEGGQRNLRRGSTPDLIQYEIYKNSLRTQRFGSVGSERLVGTGFGGRQSLRFYGQVPGGQDIPWVGTYTDTVVVTMEY